jgi:hypothetical protein
MTEGLVRKRKYVNNKWKVIQTLMISLQTGIIAKKVTSAENKADALSRGERGNLELRRRVEIKIPGNLNRVLQQM